MHSNHKNKQHTDIGLHIKQTQELEDTLQLWRC